MDQNAITSVVEGLVAQFNEGFISYDELGMAFVRIDNALETFENFLPMPTCAEFQALRVQFNEIRRGVMYRKAFVPVGIEDCDEDIG